LDATPIAAIGQHVGQEVEVAGWLRGSRSSGRIAFLQVRDGTGLCQAVVSAQDVGPERYRAIAGLGQESSLRVRGRVRADARAPGGYELLASAVLPQQNAVDYPITPKEHGVEFLLDHRHLWLRSPRQAAILRIRAELAAALMGWLDEHGFVRVDAPILTPNAAEGTTTLFEVDYFGEKAYLTQSGQLYMEAAAMALGKVYCFGPTFRAEKSKTRRHLIEFWMLEPEVAWAGHDENLAIQEALVCHAVQRVLERRGAELELIGRDPEPLRRVLPPFPRITYDDALAVLAEKGLALAWGEDFGAPHESALAEAFDRPVFVERFPAKIKAFYMQPAPERPEVVLAADLLAPEGYGEIIGGSERIADPELLAARIREHGLGGDVFSWYTDLRRYGSVPHAGFGLGLERLLAWVCGLEHVRETIPFPRLLNRIRP
jgi:asparaginyl-tRNA synthetase